MPDDEDEIVAALNALRARYTYVFTTGGIGPTHDDITADCVAKAFGVPIDFDPEAVAILQRTRSPDGHELNEARMRMARIPRGATLVANKVSGAPGFWIGNVIMMAGVPAIMQAMLDEVRPKLKTGVKMLSETIRADAREGDVGTELGDVAKAHPEVTIGSYPFFDEELGPNTNIVVRARDAQKLAAAKAAVERMLVDARRQLAAHNSQENMRIEADAGPTAVARPDKIFPVSWDQFHRDARALAWRLHAAGPFEAVVCITRGGLVPAAVVARELERAHDRDGLRHKLSELQEPGRAEGAERRGAGRSRSPEGKGVLIVDDLVDTGKTARVVRELLPAAHFATVYAKPMGRPLVDTFVTEVSQDTWIYFPWDTGLAFQPPIRPGGD